MEIKVYNDTVTAAETICDTRVELPVETELLIPDYLPQVFKIVKCLVSLVLLQRQVSAARLTLEGYLRVVVFYQSDTEGGLCQTEQKLPFSRQVELRKSECFGAQVQVSGETEYINCRAVNQRRVDIRGAYALDVTVSAQTGSEIITALSESGVQQKVTTLSGVKTVAVLEKLFSAEESLSFETAPEAIVHISCAGVVREQRLLTGKAVLKGELTAQLLYRTAQSTALQQMEKTIAFNEIVEGDALSETCRGAAFAEAVGCTVTSGDDGTYKLSVTTALRLKAYQPVEILAVCDAFSTLCETQLTFGEVSMEQELEQFSHLTEAVADGDLPDDSAQVLVTLAEATPPELQQQGDQTVLMGHVQLHMLCKNALGEIDCYDKTCDYTLPNQYAYPREALCLLAQATVVSAQAQKTGTQARAAVQIQVDGVLTRRTAHTVLRQIVCGEERVPQDDGVALRIYYAQKDEAMFDIARRYAVSPQAIAAVNDGQPTDTVAEDTQLLIPVQA